MKTVIAVLSLVFTTSAFAGLDIRFKGDCRHASFDAQEGDIEFSNLNLDIDANDHRQHQKCEIRTSFPVRDGYKLVVSSFNVQADAIVKHDGFAALSLRHNFKDRGWKQDEDKARHPGNKTLEVWQRAIGHVNCNEPAHLETEIISEARRAILLQQAARLRISIKYKYEKCH